MPDASERGGALAALYRSIKRKEGGYVRMDKTKAIEQANKNAEMRGSFRKPKSPKK